MRAWPVEVGKGVAVGETWASGGWDLPKMRIATAISIKKKIISSQDMPGSLAARNEGRSSLLANVGSSSSIAELILPFQKFFDNLLVGPWDFFAVRDRHGNFRAFAGDDDGIADLRRADRLADCFFAVEDAMNRERLRKNSRLDLIENSGRVFVVRIFVGQKDLIAVFFGERAEFRPFPFVAAAAGRAKDTNWFRTRPDPT